MVILGNEDPFGIPEDLPKLSRAIERVGARLVVIDPIMAFLGENINSNSDKDVRSALKPLKQLAERTGAAGVIVRHLNKTPGGQRPLPRRRIHRHHRRRPYRPCGGSAPHG